MGLARFGRCMRGVGLFFLFSLLMTGAARADRLSVVGRLSLPGTQTRIVADGSRAYLAGGAAGVHIVDVSNPTSPTLLGTLDTTGTAQGLAVSGARLYVADGKAGLLVADVSDPARPKVLGAYDTPGDAKAVVTSGTLAFVADGEHGLQIIDASNPARPVKAGSFDTYLDPNMIDDSSDAHDAKDVKLYGGAYALVADGTRLMIVDLHDLRNPTLLSRLVLDYSTLSICLDGSSAYVFLSWMRTPARIDLSDLAFPDGLPGVLSGDSWGAARSGSLFYVVRTYSTGVEVVDVSLPDQPALRCACSTNGAARDVAAQGDIAYVANGEGGLAVLRHETGPFLRIIKPDVGYYQIEPGKPFKLRWSAENLTGMLKLELASFDWNSPAKWTLSNIPVSQGAAGYDVTIPANYSYTGTNYLRLKSADGQTTASVGLSVREPQTGPDTTAPSLMIDYPNGVTYGLQAHLSEVCVSGSASDWNGIALVEACVDNGAWMATELHQERWWRKVLNLGPGTHSVTVRARDNAGNYSEPLTRMVSPLGFDRIPPVIEVGQPQDLAVLRGDCTLTVSGTASDLGTTSTGVTGVWMEQNEDRFGRQLSGTTEWSGQTRLVHGVNTFAFRCADANAASIYRKNYSPVKTLSVLYDPPVTTPTLAIASPANRQTVASRTVRVSGTAAAGGANVDMVEVRVNGGAWKLTSGTAAWSLDCALLPGFNTIEAHAIDAHNFVSKPVAVTVRCQPATDIISPRGSIGGLSNSVALKGSTVLMSEGTRVLVLDASNESSVVKLAAMELGEMVYDLAVDGAMVYVAAGRAGLQAYDLTDPAHPQWRGGCRGAGSGAAMVVAAAGGYAYVRTDWFSLLVFDVASPEGPRLLQEIPQLYGSSGGTYRLAVAGSRLFAGQAGYPLRAFDLSDPAHPAQAFTCGSSAGDFAVSGNTLVLVNGAVLTAYDVGSPGTALGTLTLAEQIVDVQYSGTRLLALLASGALDVIDASNPASLKRLGTITVLGSSAGYALAASPTRAYAATAAGLRIYDPAMPGGQLVGRYATIGEVKDVATAGQIAWVVGSGRLGAVDVSNPDDPVLLSTLAISNIYPYGRMRASGNRVFVPLINGSKGDFALVDATDPAKPVLTSGRVSPAGSLSALDLATYGDLAYVGTSGYLEVYDCANIANPVRVTSVTLNGNVYSGPGAGYMVERSGSTLMVALNYQGVEFFDLTDPRRPEPGAMYYGPPSSGSSGTSIYHMAVDGRTAVLTTYGGIPSLLDCPNAWMPRELPSAPSWLNNFAYPAVSGPWVVLGRPEIGTPGVLNLCKLSSSGALTLVDSCPSVPSLKRMAFAGKTLCQASGTLGLRLVQMNFPNAVADWGAYE